MKFTIPLLLSAVALASLTWLITNLNPVELPPGIRVNERCTPLLSSK
jgi:hypothetical protein